MQKRNRITQEYENYVIPKDRHCPIYSNDMEQLVNCASCGKLVKYGISYTSRLIHNHIGFGYSVCEKCYYEDNNLAGI